MSEKDTIDFRFDDVDPSFDFEDTVFEKEKTEVTPEPTIEVEKVDENPRADEFLDIYDALMFEDKFEKTYSLGKKYKVVLTTRPADADMSIARQLDSMKFETMHALQTMSAILTLSHSLVELKGKDMRGMKASERYTYLKTCPSHLIEMISRKVVDFDQLVREALAYGEENF